MLFHPPFNLPYNFRPQYRYNNPPFFNKQLNNNYKIPEKENINSNKIETEDSKHEQTTSSAESSDYFFEIFGLKLYYDDILIICLLFFLYTEGINDQELFLCLILLLLS